MSEGMSALVVKSPHIDRILAGKKTWELRGSRTAKRGVVALVKSGANEILGACEIVGVVGPLSLSQLRESLCLHQSPEATKAAPYARTYAWVVRGAERFDEAIPYRNPPGAVIWVTLPADVAERVRCAYSRIVSGSDC